MIRIRTRFPAIVLVVFAFASVVVARDKDDDDDDKPATAPAGATTQPALAADQQDAVGIVVAHPVEAKPPQTIAAFGQVLDASSLVADTGQLDAASAAERAANADVSRLQALYRGDAGASLKVLQAAQSEQVHAHTQANAAAAVVASRWGALAKLPVAQREQLIDAAASGKHLLVRADLLGRRSVADLPTAARLDVDGVVVPARVIGVMSQASPDVQSVGVLLEVDAAPAGFGPGARVPVTLDGEARSGMLIPATALIYSEQGAHVYKQLAAKDKDGKVQYAAASVVLLQSQGDALLVGGIDDDDLIVIHGTGVLWSLQGLDVTASDDDDD